MCIVSGTDMKTDNPEVLSGSMIPAITGAGLFLMLLAIVGMVVRARKRNPTNKQGY